MWSKAPHMHRSNQDVVFCHAFEFKRVTIRQPGAAPIATYGVAYVANPAHAAPLIRYWNNCQHPEAESKHYYELVAS